MISTAENVDPERGLLRPAALSTAKRRAMGQEVRQPQTEVPQRVIGIASPANRHGADDQRIFEDEAPTDDPREQLAEHRCRNTCRRSRKRDAGRHLRVAKCGASADQAGDAEADEHRRARPVRADAGQGEDAGSDDRADPQRDEVRPGQ